MTDFPPTPRHYKPGSSVTLSARIRSGGKLANPASVVFTLCDPNGVTTTVSPSSASQGMYSADYLIPMNATPGVWNYRMQSTGVPPDQNGLTERTFVVDALAF